MIYRAVGNTRLVVSALAVGTASLRLVPEKQAIATLVAAFRAGVNLVHTAPDYEGADELVRLALQECSPPVPVAVATNAWGTAEWCERVFEETCRRFGTERLELFGIASLYDREKLGDNVWGAGGLVEFLQRKKAEGRLTAAFCSTHGPADHTAALIRRGVFDAVMLAWNPLQFHLLSYNPSTLGSVLGAATGSDWRFEDLRRVESEVFAAARETGTGLLVMKPLAGGLLAHGRAFTVRAGMPAPRPGVRPAAILRTILAREEVCAVVPGMAHPDEVAENLGACEPSSAGETETVWQAAQSLAREWCSRCGECDGTCRKGLPLSWLFRAAYLHLFPSVTHELDDRLTFAALHPESRTACLDCQDPTCRCPSGLTIQDELPRLHRGVAALRRQGQWPATPPASPPVRPWDCRVVYCDLPETLPAGGEAILRIFLENTGSAGWWASPGPDHSCVRLSVAMDGTWVATLAPRVDVPPGGRVHFVVSLHAPARVGPCRLVLALGEVGAAPFGPAGAENLAYTIEIV